MPLPGDELIAAGQPPASWRINAQRTVSYEVSLRPDLLNPDDPTLVRAAASDERGRPRRLVVLETHVDALYGARIRRYLSARDVTHGVCVIDAHERVKTMESVFRIVTAMDEFGVARRREPVIAIGGGVLTDIVGLAASLYRRSTPYVRVPTTLVGMVDASIGAKTGVNFDQHKNRLGTYHPSAVTLIDPAFLDTLSPRHLRNGLAEVLKIALIKDPALFALLEAHGPRLLAERMQRTGSADGGAAATETLRLSIHGMLEELQPNLWEHQLCRAVDYGHSFSPTIEMQALPELLHGEAVAIDMALTVLVAHGRGLLDAGEVARVRAVMAALGLPSWHRICTPELLARALAETVRHRDGRQAVPLTAGIGACCFVDDVSTVELDAALATLRRDAGGGATGVSGGPVGAAGPAGSFAPPAPAMIGPGGWHG